MDESLAPATLEGHQVRLSGEGEPRASPLGILCSFDFSAINHVTYKES